MMFITAIAYSCLYQGG